MASHFRTPGTPGNPDNNNDDLGATRRATRRTGSARHSASHAAPAGDSPVGFVPVVSAEPTGSSTHGRRSRSSRFKETDPYDLSGRRSGDPRKRAARIISTLLFVVGVVLLITAGVIFIKNKMAYDAQDRINASLAQHATLSDDGSTPPTVDWDGLRAINNEVVGWVEIPGTAVNFPVYQTTDNDKYLHTNAEGEESVGGQIFMDAENHAPGMVDAQTIIYGHHLRNGAMFKPVFDMEKQDVFDSIKTVWYVTPEQNYELVPLMLYHTESDDENARTFEFPTQRNFSAYLSGLLARSVSHRADADKILDRVTHVMTLCTCNYSNGDYGRTLLVCAPKGEVEGTASTNNLAANATGSGTAVAAKPEESKNN